MTRQRYFRKVIRIRAEDSPNVRLALAQQTTGRGITNEVLVPGVLTWADYQKRRATWDPVRQCIGLDAQFWEGKEALLFPPLWLNHSENLARLLPAKLRDRRAEGVGIDPAEGGDKTAVCAVDQFGVIELVSERTPDTNVIVGRVVAFCKKWSCPPDRVCVDRGGGGKQLADRMRSQGWEGVRTVPFGEAVSLEMKRGVTLFADRVEVREERYVYLNRRAQMAHQVSLLLDPSGEGGGFGIPAEYADLRAQLALIPRLTDDEGRIWLPSKGNETEQMRKSRVRTLVEIIGHSPDEFDALCLAVYAMTARSTVFVAGAV